MKNHADEFLKKAAQFRKLADMSPGENHQAYLTRTVASHMADVCEILAEQVRYLVFLEEPDEGL